MTTSTPDPRQVEYLPLSGLRADPRNPKAHDQDVIDASIGRFGVLDLIVRDERTGFIVSGHGRHKAFTGMEKRGESAPEGVKISDAGEWLVPVVTGWASRTDAEAGAALIALNRTTELGGWVDDSLLELLDELSEVEEGLVGIGYGDEDIGLLRESLEVLGDGSGDRPPAPGSAEFLSVPDEDDYTEQYAVTVVCDDEEDQAKTYETLRDMGLAVRVVTV